MATASCAADGAGSEGSGGLEDVAGVTDVAPDGLVRAEEEGEKADAAADNGGGGWGVSRRVDKSGTWRGGGDGGGGGGRGGGNVGTGVDDGGTFDKSRGHPSLAAGDPVRSSY